MKIIKKQATFKEKLDDELDALGSDAYNTEHIELDYDEALSLAKAFNEMPVRKSLFRKHTVEKMSWNVGAIHNCKYRGITLKVEGLE